MTYFVRHEPCPKCGSRDNLGVWDDGHKFCFGCRYYQASPDTAENLRKRLEFEKYNNNETDCGVSLADLSYNLPVDARNWLHKYGVSDKEITHYKLAWNERTSSLVFPIYNHENRLIYCQERYFGPEPNRPKYITYGSKTQQLGFIRNGHHYPSTCVLVEDFISAVKVARLVTAAPLLGSSLGSNALGWLVGQFRQVRLWLDLDKATESLLEASRLVPAIPDVRSILTPLDPKDYSTDRIAKFLVDSGVRK